MVKMDIMRLKKTGLIVYFIFVCANLFAQKDTLYSSNGDVIVGEIKSLSKSVLTFDTDYADSEFKIEWNKVDGLISNSILNIDMVGGEKYMGNLRYDKSKKRIVGLINSSKDKSLSLDDIVEMETLSRKFWERIYISIDAGFSFTKANKVTQVSTNGNLKYHADKWKLGGSFSNVSTNQDSVDATSRTDGKLNYSYDVWGNALVFAGMEFLNNSEQLLDLRVTSKMGVGYYLLRSNRLYLQGGVGLANTNENYGGDDPSKENSFEGVVGLDFDAYDIGDFTFNTQVNVFPTLSNSGRVRVNGNVSLKWDLPFDFYIKASYVHNFDSKPVNDTPKSDYVLQSTIGWEWD
jgi:putative salt-induced outer membrane protein YdiY